MKSDELLKYSSLFLYVATPGEIDIERLSLERESRMKLEPYRVTHETRSGARVTRVEWRVIDG